VEAREAKLEVGPNMSPSPSGWVLVHVGLEKQDPFSGFQVESETLHWNFPPKGNESFFFWGGKHRPEFLEFQGAFLPKAVSCGWITAVKCFFVSNFSSQGVGVFILLPCGRG